MKLKNFDDYTNKRLSKTEITEIKKRAEVEYQALKLLQQDVSKAINKYMVSEQIGFNELVRRLGVSTAQAVKIQKGEANLTLASLAHIAALLQKRPHLVFK
ncbi:MAG TPA: hypothetical protein VD770_03615 [Coxiellaceae bacterium]|nr:hypothetical protein [Coxiellaceae bacterium]